MRSSRNLALCFALLAAILGSVRYAVGRESLRDTDLPALYSSINRESFNDSLPSVPVEWNDLIDKRGVTIIQGDDIRIEIDRGSVTTATELREVLSHEACHVALGKDGEDGHGERFQQCMKRFE